MTIATGDMFIVPHLIFRTGYMIIRVESDPGRAMTLISVYSGRFEWSAPSKRKINFATAIRLSPDVDLPSVRREIERADQTARDAIKAADADFAATVAALGLPR